MKNTARSIFFFLLSYAVLAAPLRAEPNETLEPALSSVSFLLGSWTSGSGTVADTGETAQGRSTFSVEVGGAAILRRDHTDLATAAGKPTQSFDQIMLIYPEGGTIHADYTDGTHVIHYVSATIVPGRSLVLTSASSSGTPTYRLTYDSPDETTLAVRFEIEPPGAGAFMPIATGTLHRPRQLVH